MAVSNAGRVVWDWRGERGRATAARALRRTRLGGVVLGLVGGGVALAVRLVWSHAMAWVILGAAGTTAVTAILAPRTLYPWIARLVGVVAFGIGTVLTWLLLVPLYYAFFFPFGLLFRRGRKRLFPRAPDPAVATYWHERSTTGEGNELRAYERLF